jgi:hypothetical protein
MLRKKSPEAEPSCDSGLKISGGFAQGNIPLIKDIGYRRREWASTPFHHGK